MSTMITRKYTKRSKMWAVLRKTYQKSLWKKATTMSSWSKSKRVSQRIRATFRKLVKKFQSLMTRKNFIKKLKKLNPLLAKSEKLNPSHRKKIAYLHRPLLPKSKATMKKALMTMVKTSRKKLRKLLKNQIRLQTWRLKTKMWRTVYLSRKLKNMQSTRIKSSRTKTEMIQRLNPQFRNRHKKKIRFKPEMPQRRPLKRLHM